jgi:type II secretory pathway component PulC
MHPAIRRHVWVLQLGLIAAVALTAARLVNLTLEVLINGFEMSTPENALEAYTRLREANQVEVELVRNGSAIRKSYSVR